MITSPASLGSHPEAANAVLRLPGAPPADGAAPMAREPVSRVPEALTAPAHYDPSKLRENLQQAIEHLNKQLASSGRSLGFSMDDVLNRPVVTVRSTQTGEVIRQIPSEAVLKVAHTFEHLKGLLYDAST